DRSIELPSMSGMPADVWATVATGHPTLLEVAGLPSPEAPDIDEPLLGLVEELLRPLLDGGFTVSELHYRDSGDPDGSSEFASADPEGDPLIVILATRNAAVNAAHELVERLSEEFELPDGVISASTVDKWQGQTNRITIGIHPLSAADQL